MSQDTGFAWVVLAASFWYQIVNGGLTTCAGILYIMFKENVEGDDTTIAFVTSLNIAMYLLFCPPAGMFSERFGERPVAIFGTILTSLGIALTALASKVFHLYLTFSLIAGAGRGIGYCCSMSILSRHFKKYNRLAYGITTAGTGLSSLVLPPILMALEDTYGWRGAILMFAGIYAQTTISSCLYRPIERDGIHLTHCKFETNTKENDLKTSNSEENGHKQIHAKSTYMAEIEGHEIGADDVLNYEHEDQDVAKGSESAFKQVCMKTISLFRITAFLCFCLHYSCIFFSLMIIYTHFGSYVLSCGFSKSHVVLLYMTMGISVTLGRASVGLVTGLLGLNSLTVVMVSAFINGIVTLTVPLVNSLVFFYAYAVLVCFLSAPTYVLIMPIIMKAVPTKQVATAFGIANFCTVPASLSGAPFAAWLHRVTKIYASSFYLASGIFALASLAIVPALIHSRKTKGSDNKIQMS